jgi:hypothetical protein
MGAKRFIERAVFAGLALVWVPGSLFACADTLALEGALQAVRTAAPSGVQPKENALAELLRAHFKQRFNRRELDSAFQEDMVQQASIYVIKRLRRARSENEEKRTYMPYIHWIGRVLLMAAARTKNQGKLSFWDPSEIDNHLPKKRVKKETVQPLPSTPNWSLPMQVNMAQMTAMRQSAGLYAIPRLSAEGANSQRKQVTHKLRARFRGYSITYSDYFPLNDEPTENEIEVRFTANGTDRSLVAIAPTVLEKGQLKQLGKWVRKKSHQVKVLEHVFKRKAFEEIEAQWKTAQHRRVYLTPSAGQVLLLRALQVRDIEKQAAALEIDPRTLHHRVKKIAPEILLALSPEEATQFHLVEMEFYPLGPSRDRFCGIWRYKGLPLFFEFVIRTDFERTSHQPILVSEEEIQDALDRISDLKVKNVLISRLNGDAYGDIAKRLGIQESTVREYSQFGMRSLGTLLRRPLLNAYNLRIYERPHFKFTDYVPDRRDVELRDPIEILRSEFLSALQKMEQQGENRSAEALRASLLGPGDTDQAIAQRGGYTIGTARTYISRGIAFLRKDFNLPNLRRYNICIVD